MKHKSNNLRIWIILLIFTISCVYLFDISRLKLNVKNDTSKPYPKTLVNVSTNIMESKFPLSTISNQDEKRKYIIVQIASTVLFGVMGGSVSSIIMKMMIPSHLITTGFLTKRMLHPKYISWFTRLFSSRHLGYYKFQNVFKKFWGSIVKKQKSVSTANDLSNMLDMKEDMTVDHK